MLNYGDDGDMKSAIVNDDQVRTWVICDDQQVIAWAVVRKYPGDAYSSELMVYVRKKYRKRGLATKLVKAVLDQTVGSIVIHEHDSRSIALYNAIREGTGTSRLI